MCREGRMAISPRSDPPGRFRGNPANSPRTTPPVLVVGSPKAPSKLTLTTIGFTQSCGVTAAMDWAVDSWSNTRMKPSPQKERQRIRWSLRSLLLLFFVAALCLGWWRDRQKLNALTDLQTRINGHSTTMKVTVLEKSPDTVVLAGVVAEPEDIRPLLELASMKYENVTNLLAVDPAAFSEPVR